MKKITENEKSFLIVIVLLIIIIFISYHDPIAKAGRIVTDRYEKITQFCVDNGHDRYIGITHNRDTGVTTYRCKFTNDDWTHYITAVYWNDTSGKPTWNVIK